MAAKPYRIPKLEQTYGDLHTIIPKLANELGQVKAANRLGISSASINRWLKKNGYVLQMQYVRRESEADE